MKVITINKQVMAVYEIRYANGHIGIELALTDGYYSPDSHLSTCNDHPLGHREFHVMPGHSHDFYRECLESGFFRDTGKRVPHGFSHIHVWEIVEEKEDAPTAGPADLDEVVEAAKELIEAAKIVVKRWEDGNLAEAVRNLQAVASFVEFTLESVAAPKQTGRSNFQHVWDDVFSQNN